MKFPLVSCLWALLGLLLLGHGSLGCLEEERIALLKLKASINHPNGSALPSWGGEVSDCCSWEKVKCDNNTKRVIQLFLSHTRQYKVRAWFLNATLFDPLEDLKILDLYGNYIEDLSGVFRLNNLQVLNLSLNRLTRLPLLGALPSLKVLEGQRNYYLKNVHFEDLTTLSNLEVLDLGYGSLTGNLPQSIGSLTSLKTLSLTGNELNGSLPAEGLCKLRNLQELDLSHNGFQGNIPPCLGNLTLLRMLELSENYLGGVIPSFIFPCLKSLKYVSLSKNCFEGSFSLSSLAQNTKLEVFELVNLNNQLKLETENPPWSPPFQLKSFRLSNCMLNEPSRAIPSFLLSQYDLRMVDLSDNNITGKIPTWLFVNNTKLEYLKLMNNFLIGPLHFPSTSINLNMSWFDISGNHIHGEIPPNIGSVFPNLHFLNMSRCALQGIIPPSVGDMRFLQYLDFSNNNLSGQLPERLFMSSVQLELVKLSNNSLHGQIFPTKSNLTKLLFLSLNRNQFTGEIPVSHALLNNSHLGTLDIGNNYLSGKVPDWIGSFLSLTSLILSGNSFEGPLPNGFCKLKQLQILDLSRNNFSQAIPPCFHVSSLLCLHLQSNVLTGPIPNVLSGASSLVTLELSNNKLSGEIPVWISLLSSLRVLLLKGNSLHGIIPIQLCKLKTVSILDLSHNNLSGVIPSCLNNINIGRVGALDESFRRLVYKWTENVSSKYRYHRSLEYHFTSYAENTVLFVSKSRFESYKGTVLRFMSGMDLSYNNLTGPIPPEIGDLSIHTLNLSYNHIIGSIPETFSNLKDVESLDLSHNTLSGKIPSQLTELYSLSVFTVAYNNLSGRTPERKAQFATFDKSSYEGNSLLCGPPLERNCTITEAPGTQPPSDIRESDSMRETFVWSFAGSFVVAFLGVIAFLYFNSYYNNLIFSFIEAHIPSFY